jgi:hypothetical protein
VLSLLFIHQLDPLLIIDPFKLTTTSHRSSIHTLVLALVALEVRSRFCAVHLLLLLLLPLFVSSVSKIADNSSSSPTDSIGVMNKDTAVDVTNVVANNPQQQSSASVTSSTPTQDNNNGGVDVCGCGFSPVLRLQVLQHLRAI